LGIVFFCGGGWSKTAKVVSGVAWPLLLLNELESPCSERPELNPLELDGLFDRAVGIPLYHFKIKD
jgi:hypothetical protein